MTSSPSNARSEGHTLPRTALIVLNPKSRSAPSADALVTAAQPLRDAGWDVELALTTGAAEATAIARRAADRGVEVVVAVGGDGTVNEVMNGLVGSATALAVVPTGTANVWAIESGVPRDPQRALALVPSAERRRIDTGSVTLGNGVARHFLLMAGAGIDGAVVRLVDGSRFKQRFGKLAFAWHAVHVIVSGRPTLTVMERDSDTRSLPLLQVVVSNTRLYGGVLRIASDAHADDGVLDVVSVGDPNPTGPFRVARLLRLLASVARGALHGRTSRGIAYERATALTLRPNARLHLQIDGEHIGECGPDEPARFAVHPRSLLVLAPAPQPGLLGNDAP